MARDEHIVDKHKLELISRVSNASPILDELLIYKVIRQREYDKIRTLATSQEKMRGLFRGPLESSGVRGKEIFYKILNTYEPYLIEDLKKSVQEETRTDKKILSETLKDLSSEEFKEFISLIELEVGLPLVTRRKMEVGSTQDMVEQMVAMYSREMVKLTKNALRKMNKTDLVQRLSDVIPGAKERQYPSLSQRVETMVSVIELLLETLKSLSDGELKKFKEVLSQSHFHRPDVYKHDSDTQWMQLVITGIKDVVFLMVLTYGQKSVERTEEVLKMIKRTDLVQTLSDSGSGPRKKEPVDERLSPLIHKVATMIVVKELLSETLNDLSRQEQEDFKWLLNFRLFQRNLPHMSPLQLADNADFLVNLMVDTCGQQSVELTKEVFMDLNRTDLVQRLAETSSGPEEKHSLDEQWPALIQKVETMASVIELLLETLKDLSVGELEEFTEALSQSDLHRRGLHRHYSDFSLLLKTTEKQDTVFFMVQMYGQRSVEKIKEALKKIKRTDLVQKLSGPKRKHSADKRRSALILRVATMAAVEQLLLETLNDLSNEELKRFTELLQLIVSHKGLRGISSMLSLIAEREKIVNLMLQTYGQQSLELTREAFMEMSRTDLVEKLSKPSSGLKKKHSVDELQPAASERIEHVLLETLEDLSCCEFEKFKWLLPFTSLEKSLPQISYSRLQNVDTADQLVVLMLERHGQQSVEVTKEVFMDMNRNDLLQRLSQFSSGPKDENMAASDSASILSDKHSEEELLSARMQKQATITSDRQRILEMLEELKREEFEKFKWILGGSDIVEGLPRIPRSRLENKSIMDVVDLLLQTYKHQSVEVTKKVFRIMNLSQRLSQSSSGSEGPSTSLELDAGGSVKRESSDWTLLEPEVSSTDAHEASTYRLQSEAGRFECSVSGLRWVCKEKVCFKYQFCSWEEHLERIEGMKYMPAGPLIDITVISGKLDEVYLPHWICLDDNRKISDKFAALHIDDCGDVVEKVSEVTSSHVKLSEPVFSPRAALMKAGFPVKIHCIVLIYKSNTAFLTLHVYIIPFDPGLEKEMNNRELSYGFNIIRKPPPSKSLRMRDRFILTADLDGAEIYPENLKLKYEGRSSQYFEVYIKNPDTDFKLNLTKEKEHQPVWTGAFRTDEYKSTAHVQGAAQANPLSALTSLSAEEEACLYAEQFVNEQQCELIKRVKNVDQILDHLLTAGVIQQGVYNEIFEITNAETKMRKIYSGPLVTGGRAAKVVFYRILQQENSYLVADLEKKYKIIQQ